MKCHFHFNADMTEQFFSDCMLERRALGKVAASSASSVFGLLSDSCVELPETGVKK
jgi:hypothetical protein